MRGASVFGGERRTLLGRARKLPTVLIFLLVLATPLVAQATPPTAPSFVNVGPGANQRYWINPNQFQGNWGASSFFGSPSNTYQYGINQDPAGAAGFITSV